MLYKEEFASLMEHVVEDTSVFSMRQILSSVQYQAEAEIWLQLDEKTPSRGKVSNMLALIKKAEELKTLLACSEILVKAEAAGIHLDDEDDQPIPGIDTEVKSRK